MGGKWVQIRIPLCVCGRRRIQGGRAECSDCRYEHRPRPPICVCGQRWINLGRAVCHECRILRHRPCIICDKPSRGLACRLCRNLLRRDDRRRKIVARLKAQGLTFQAIGQRMGGISRQRAEQMYRWPKSRARQILQNALASGRIQKPPFCERCEQETARLDGHHADYSKPLNVDWLCVPCHNIVHPHPGRGCKPVNILLADILKVTA